MRIKALLTFCLMVLSTFTLQSQENSFENGWKSFKENNYEAAKTHFLRAVEMEQKADEALIMLSILASINETPKASFEYFNEFFEIASESNPYLFSLWLDEQVSNSAEFKDEYRIEFIEELLENPKVNSEVKAMAYDMLNRIYDELGDFEKADEYGSELGTTNNWQILGEFDNISASGFDKEYDALKHPEASHTFINNRGANVNWYDLPEHRIGKWIHFYYYFYANNSIVFAQTFCYSPTEREVHLRIGTSGSLKTWVNDFEVLNIEEERNNNLDTYIVKVKLNKGYNRILLQIGESEAESLNFLFRITNQDGFVYDDLTYQSNYTEETKYDKNYKYNVETIPLFAEEFFLNKIETEKDNLLNYFLLAKAYLINDKSEEARKILDKALEISPKCAYTHWLLVDAYGRSDNRTNLSKTLEYLKENDKNNPTTLSILFTEEIDEENYDKAEEYLDLYGEIKGYEYPEYLLLKMRLLNEKQNNKELFELMEYAYRSYPNNLAFLSIKYNILKSVGNERQALSILEDYTEDYFSYSILKDRIDHHLNNLEYQDAIDIYIDLLEETPEGIGHLDNIAGIYKAQRNFEKAKEYFEQCVEIAPFIGYYWGEIADCEIELGNETRAIELLKKSIHYSPNSFSKRKRLRELESKSDIFEYFEEPDMYALFEKTPEKSDYPEDNSVILLDEVQKVVYPEGASEEKYYFAVKVLDLAGIDTWKEYNIGQYSSESLDIQKAEVIKKDGSKVKAEVSGSSVVFPALEAGDGILLVYVKKVYALGKLQKHFWDKHYFSMYVPYLKSKYSLMVPKDKKFQHTVINSSIKPEIKDTDEDFKIYKWEKANQAAMKYESYMPLLSDIGEILHISSIPDWKFVSDWYDDLSKSKSKNDYDVKNLYQEIFKDKQNLSKRDKVNEIYQYIVKNIRYSYVPFRQSGMIPQKASKTIVTKIGDCKDVSTLFVSLAKEAGIDANLVLVDTRQNGAKDMVLPSIEFDHCIANVNIDNKDYYVELTNDFNPFSTIGYNLKEAFVLDIDPKQNTTEPKYLNPKTRLRNSIYRNGSSVIEGKDIKVTQNTLKTGSNGSRTRSFYRDIGDEERRKSMAEAIRSDYPNSKLEKLSFGEALNTLSDSVDYMYVYTIKNHVMKMSSWNLLKIPFSDALSEIEFISDDERKQAVDFWKFLASDEMIETMSVELPEKKKLIEMPKDVNMKNEYAEYSMIFKMKGQVLTATRTFRIFKDHIPTKDYKMMSDFLSKVIETDQMQIGFK